MRGIDRSFNPPGMLSRTRLYVVAFLATLAWGGGPGAAMAQAQGPAQEPARGEELRVYLMTMGPGTFVWERFGHNAIRITDAARGTDIAYNYGMFSFDQDGFLLRFIRGHMDYWMQGFDAGLTAQAYIHDDRSVWLQELNLTPAQRADLQDFLEWNARPENSIYRYDYYADNCSTRVRDAIDRVLGGQIRERTAGVMSGTTYRDHTRMLTADDPLVFAGLMAGLGQPVDREISVWEEMFLPMRLRDIARDLEIVGPDGSARPFVLTEEQIYASATVAEGDDSVPGRVPGFLLVGLIVGGALLGLAYLGGVSGAASAAASGGARVGFGLLATGWSLVAGALGWVLLGLWLFTDHAAAYRNENILQLSPLLLALVLLIPIGLRRGGGAMSWASRVADAAAGGAILGLLLQLLPGMDQSNGEIIALALPINVALALGLRWLIRTVEGRTGALRAARLPADDETQ